MSSIINEGFCRSENRARPYSTSHFSDILIFLNKKFRKVLQLLHQVSPQHFWGLYSNVPKCQLALNSIPIFYFKKDDEIMSKI